MGKVTEVKVDLPHPVLTDADWADGFVIETTHLPYTCTRDAAERCFGQLQKSIGILLAIRNALVRPFGLETGEGLASALDRVGIFPVLSQTDKQVVLGLDDRHLDFRLVVDVETSERQQHVCAITLIKRHNWFGRAYLFVITPFHRVIMRRALENLIG